MASGKTLNAANLEALGPARLAALLLEISAGDAVAKRRLRLALAGNAGSAEAADEIAKRLASIARAKSFIDWQKVKPLAADLAAQHRAILDLVAPSNPREAFELLWRMVRCAESVFARSDDGSGRLASVFREAAVDLGPLAQAAKLDSLALADRAFDALRDAGYGQWDDLVTVLAPQLGTSGLGHLKELMAAWQAEPSVAAPKRARRVIGYGTSGAVYADEVETGHRQRTARFVLQQIADALGDVDGYIAQFDAKARKVPMIAAEIARRLLDAGRLQEAWTAIEAVEQSKERRLPIEWEQTRIDTFEALGRADEAQTFRWQRFAETLNASHLRAYLRKLPDFESFDVELRAMAHALDYPDLHRALMFFVAWPDLGRASRLVLTRGKELNGNRYELLTPAADALEHKHPLAATVARRAMIDFTLDASRASRYKHAARHLAECGSLACRIDDYAGIPTHPAYTQALRAAHGRKASFWQEVGPPDCA